VDRLVIVTAPLVIGSGVEAVGDLGIRRLSEALRPERVRVRRVGSDLVWEMELHGA
jgi:5-amino-6-(5-phosphoribosylamino)uracil reductase/diaminohydroxyphosphoribosylaminopyrimidine deaminase/5-amino-6-(5-phosphoribosylamino)uracil reductase